MSPVELVAEYQIGWRMNPPAVELSLTFEDAAGGRGSTRTEPASVMDALVYGAILRLSRPRYFDSASKAVMTTQLNVATENADPAVLTGSQAVREFDARWAPGSGGWILLRFVNYKRFLYRFDQHDADRFLALIAALDKSPTFFHPDIQVVRGVSESAPFPGWAHRSDHWSQNPMVPLDAPESQIMFHIPWSVKGKRGVEGCVPLIVTIGE